MWWTACKEKTARYAAILDDDPGTSDLAGWLDGRVKAEEGRFKNLAREPFSLYSPSNETVYLNPAQRRLLQRAVPSPMRSDGDASGWYLDPAQAHDLREMVGVSRHWVAPGKDAAGVRQFERAIQEAQDDGSHGLALVVPRHEDSPALGPEGSTDLFHAEAGKAAAHERVHLEQARLRPSGQRHLEHLTLRDMKPILSLPESETLRRFLEGKGYADDPATVGAEGAAWLGSGDEDEVFGELVPGEGPRVEAAARTWLVAYARAVTRKYGPDALRKLLRFSSPLTQEVILLVLGPELEARM